MRFAWIVIWVWGCSRAIEPPALPRFNDDIRIGSRIPFVVAPLANDTVYQSFGFRLISPTQNGTLKALPGVFFLYSPDNLPDTLDSFEYELTVGNSRITRRVLIQLAQVWPCNRGAVTDFDTTFRNAAPKPISVTDNDRFCGQKPDSVMIAVAPSHGTAFMRSGLPYYQPNTGYVGYDTFVYQTFTNGKIDFAPVFIRIFQAKGCVIAAQPDNYAFVYTGKTYLDVLSNDKITCHLEFDPNRFQVVIPPAQGNLWVEDKKLVFELSRYFSGKYTAFYEICYRNGDCSLAELKIEVLPCPPIKASDDEAFMQPEWKTLEFNYLSFISNDIYCTNNLRNLEIVSSPQHGEITTKPDRFIYTFRESSLATIDSFAYRICDWQSRCDTAIMRISIRR